MEDKMPLDIFGFSQIEYLAVFNTVLFGVVATEFFTGWGNMLRFRNQVKFYWLHFAWTIFAFFTLVQNWYGIWPRTEFINDNFYYFIYSLVPMFVFHLITVALFPSMKTGRAVDYKVYYDKNARMLFILFAVYFALTISSSYIYQDVGNVLMQNLLRGVGVAAALLVAFLNKHRWIQIVFVVVAFGALVSFIRAIPEGKVKKEELKEDCPCCEEVKMGKVE